MPSGKYIRTEEHKKRLSKSHKGQIQSEETKRKRSESMKGKNTGPRSKETKIKISESNKGKNTGPLSEEHKHKISKSLKGKPSHNKGKKKPPFSKEHKKRLSESHKGVKKGPPSEEHRNNISKAKKGKYMGENAANWKGGISCEPYCPLWNDQEYKNDIKDRDENRCLNPDCWNTAKRLSIHHIDYNKKECKPTNLITLCTSCNSRANKDRDWHKSWYQTILYRRYGYVY